MKITNQLLFKFLMKYPVDLLFMGKCHHKQATHVAQVVKNLPANAGDAKDMGSIPGLG